MQPLTGANIGKAGLAGILAAWLIWLANEVMGPGTIGWEQEVLGVSGDVLTVTLISGAATQLRKWWGKGQRDVEQAVDQSRDTARPGEGGADRPGDPSGPSSIERLAAQN